MVNSNGNYLSALGPSQQSAFQSGSFDVYAHPATTSLSGQVFYPSNGQYDIVNNYTSFDQISSFNMTTRNNLGVTAGSAFETATNVNAGRLVIFEPDPHSVVQPQYGPLSTTIQSPGYLIGVQQGPGGQFYGNVSGINDHNVVAYTQYQYFGSTATLIPHIDGLTDAAGFKTDQSLGTLGGTNGAAFALNNANQVVGWSQIASGAAHAFLYTAGSMQDLNSLIPPSSGIVLTSAVGIDAAGEIIAYGTDAGGQSHEYLLTPTESPVPEPGSLAVVTSMFVALAVRRARLRHVSRRS